MCSNPARHVVSCFPHCKLEIRSQRLLLLWITNSEHAYGSKTSLNNICSYLKKLYHGIFHIHNEVSSRFLFSPFPVAQFPCFLYPPVSPLLWCRYVAFLPSFTSLFHRARFCTKKSEDKIAGNPVQNCYVNQTYIHKK